MQTRVQKWGNSLAVRIPKLLAAELGLKRNSPVELTLEDGRLALTPATESALSLEDLLALVTEENQHHEIDTGPSVGREVW